MEAFGFQGGPEALHGSVVVTVTGGAHALDQTMMGQELTAGGCGVLAPPIGVEEGVVLD